MGTALWNVASKGKGEFKSLAVSVIDDIGKMITKMLMLNAIKSGASALGVSSWFGWADGVIPATAASMTSPVWFTVANGWFRNLWSRSLACSVS